ncbi:isopentenyl-diphosphate delta-isomerase [Desulfonispora thiosulfatigenes DSM 11270]|uniref:Isopentenyl-diphosphate delta-isomerase n=1 Tax=Desulfonispora thiosulfatigenes DSM 11270 TaxID=656914 RepID=A0A1W1VM25_DESTI|nr:type 2 isopentenyl-diphosphate Delta-isomerase [Desulfonispora thiosulfatigenes]SMB94429.1 isopentenyl-diphosphate delta-isomerase [Desulfonispora thiosulfatigenes DSM 11270]
MDIRQQRKWDHLKLSLQADKGPLKTGFDDIYLIHQALANTNFNDVNCSIEIFKKKIDFPLIINAMTGGADGLDIINKKLANIARTCNVVLAVGSQTSGVLDRRTRHTYEVVRKTNPDGLILANVSALVDVKIALEAIEMIEANAIQLHLNVAQELAMDEGDREFEKLEENILKIKEKSNVPIIIKEVGFGLSKETIQKLTQYNINYFDIGGAGGTNFASIEVKRSKNPKDDIINWGIPTAISLVEALSVSKNINLFASGGIRSTLDMVKSLTLGAKGVGIAEPILKDVYINREKEVIVFLQEMKKQLKKLMILCGAKNIPELQNIPALITGFSKEWLELRGISVDEYARRNQGF